MDLKEKGEFLEFLKGKILRRRKERKRRRFDRDFEDFLSKDHVTALKDLGEGNRRIKAYDDVWKPFDDESKWSFLGLRIWYSFVGKLYFYM